MMLYDDFLSVDNLDYLRQRLVGTEATFPWYYNPFKVYEDGPGFQFIHSFFWDGEQTSMYFSMIDRLLISKMDVKQLIRVKANLTTRTNDPVVYGMHIDDENHIHAKTAVFYVNNTNGPLMFETGEMVECVSNRLVVFDGDRKHSAVSSTDSDTRIAINFLYY